MQVTLNNKSNFNPKGQLTIEDIYIWMDGGTITVIASDMENNKYEIEFVQKVILKKYNNHPIPGSLLLNRQVIETRSEIETRIISSIKNAEWGHQIKKNEKKLYKQMLSECINFIVSDNYLDLARKMGRIL